MKDGSYHLLTTQKVPGFVLYHTQQNSQKRLYFFSCFGHDDLRHIEITYKTLNKLLNQRQDWGTKPGFSKFKGQFFNHYVSISL